MRAATLIHSILGLMLLTSGQSLAERPLLTASVDSFVSYYGVPDKSFETAAGSTRMWKRGPFLVTYIVQKEGGYRLTVAKVDGTEINRREAFAVAERFCGKQDWSIQSQSDEFEIYTNPDRSMSLSYKKAREVGGVNYVGISLLPASCGIESF